MKKHLLKFLVSLSFVLLFFFFNSKTVFAETLTDINGNKYELLSDGTAKLIKYIDTCTELNDYKIKTDNGDLNITVIGKQAFHNVKVKSISLPSATTIENLAFLNCQALTDISLPSATTIESSVFSDCSSLTNVSIPNVTTIGNLAFYNCSSLHNLYIPNVTSFGSNIFYGCPDNMTVYGNKKFIEDIQGDYSSKNYVLFVSASQISLSNTSLSMKVGDTDSLNVSLSPADATIKTVSWSSSNSDVVSVDNGNIVAKAEGIAIITITAIDGSDKTATCTITVTKDNNPDPDPNPNPGPNPDPDSEKPDGNENASVKMNNMLTSLIKNAAGKNEKTVIYFKDYTGNDAISIDVFNLLAENPNAVLVLDYTFFDEDTQKDIHVHAIINQAILSKIVTSDIKLFGPACLSGFVQYYNDLPAEIKNQNY